MAEKEYTNLKEFFPFYLREHSHPVNRLLHFIGTTLALGQLVAAALFLQPWFVLGALLSGYAFAWVGHFFIEKNRPATFTYPLLSFVSDWVMWFYILTGQIGRKLEEAKKAA